jgi:UPF0755 protein
MLTIEGKKGVLARAGRFVVAIIVTIAFASALAFFLSLQPAGQGGGGELFTVERGDTVQIVASALERRRLIRSAFAFRLLARIEAEGSSLKAGTYRISPKMDTKLILGEFVSGDQALARVTVPEGYTLSQVASLLEREGVVPVSAFMQEAQSPALLAELGIPASSAEGYLFPDTYFLTADDSAESVLRLMVKSFRERIAAIPEAASLSPKELHDRVILASIVEREYKSPEEAPLIASVFYNRLKIRMALQSCATVVYVITERFGLPHPEVIYDRDLKLDDPYNTYVHRDLPPGPISNPGMTSLRAAFYPATSRFLYFRLVDAEAGTHHFSTTLEEHIDARTLFIKKVGS